MVDGLFDEADGSSKFKTPQINNNLDQYSDFQKESAGVQSFRDASDEQVILRGFLFDGDSFRGPQKSKTVARGYDYQTPKKGFKLRDLGSPDDIGNSYKKSNLPVSPDVIKNNEQNRMAMAADLGTFTDYEPTDANEPYAISNIKSKLVRKSMTTVKKYPVFRKYDP